MAKPVQLMLQASRKTRFPRISGLDNKIGGSWPVSYTHLDVYKRQAFY